MSNPSQSSVVPIILLIILLIGCIGVLYYLFKDKYFNNEPTENEKVEQRLEEIRYTMRLRAETYTGNPLSVDYTLKQSNLLQQYGEIKNGVLEYFTNATKNITYTLYADNAEYYLGRQDCANFIDDDYYDCIVHLDKTADITFTGAVLSDDSIQLIIHISDGLVRKPMYCIAYAGNLYDLHIQGMEKIVKPERITTHYDRCFTNNLDISEGFYYYTVQFQPLTKHNNFTFVMMDQGYNEDFSATYEVDNEARDEIFSLET